MKILQINHYSTKSESPRFKANLHVEETVKNVISPNEKAFVNASRMCSEWLKKEKGHIHDTMFIRKNTSMVPAVAFEHLVTKTSYAYPHEDSGYTYQAYVKEYEDLEFQVGNRVCGFWFNPKSNADKLLSDFKNMFNYLTK